MQAAVIDTLEASKRLRAGGFDEHQSEVLIKAFAGPILEGLAGKSDIAILREDTRLDLETLRNDVKSDLEAFHKDFKVELDAVRKDMAQMEAGLRKDMEQMEARFRKDLELVEQRLERKIDRISIRMGILMIAILAGYETLTRVFPVG